MNDPAARTIGIIAEHLASSAEALVAEDLRRFKDAAERGDLPRASTRSMPNAESH